MPIFSPSYIGVVNDRARLICMGAAFGGDNHLVFINVQGASTYIEMFDAELRNKSAWVSITPHERYRLRRQAGYASRTENSRYIVKKAAIPNSTDLSMIAIHSSVNADTIDQERMVSYLIYEDDEDLKVRLWHRVHRIVNIPISRSPAVMNYLLSRGTIENSGVHGLAMVKKSRTMNEAANDPITRHWESWGIKVATVSNNRSYWERLISSGIKSKVITL
jgi:hypothetical protein